MESHNHLMIPQIPPAINRIFLPSQNTALWKINKAYLWPRSKGWMRALKASIQPAATKVTNMLYLSSRGRLLCLRQIPIYLFYLAAMHFCFFIIVYAYSSISPVYFAFSANFPLKRKIYCLSLICWIASSGDASTFNSSIIAEMFFFSG